MRVVVTGGGSAGSWRIRGEQLGSAIGAEVIPRADAATLRGADVVVIVKRATNDLLDAARAGGARIVWDVVDAWPQSRDRSGRNGNAWEQDVAIHWLRSELLRVRPSLVVGATRRMTEDVVAAGFRAISLVHHHRPDIDANPIRECVEQIGYEGDPEYLGRWWGVISKECEARGLAFVVNPPRLADVDVVVALRDASGYPARNWKSNVKLANAQGSGTPFIGVREAGYLETCVPGAERFADTPKEFARALDSLAPRKERARVAGWMRAAAPSLSSVAGKLRAALQEELRR